MKKTGYRWSRGIEVVLIFMLSGLALGATSGSADAAAKNRRNGHKDCAFCHISNDPATDSQLFPDGMEPSQACLECHKYRKSHHPVNFVPERGLYRDDEENPLPLYEDEIRCLTCHQFHADRSSLKLLRGGPYADRRQICFTCHYEEQYAGINPHKMIDSNGNRTEVDGKPVCLVCHRSVPVQDGYTPRVNFKAEIAFLCWRCHPPMPDSFIKSHFLARPSLKTREIMRRTEVENGVSFPLLNRGRVTCSTCHNPHQKGVILYGAARAGEDEHDRLRMPPDQICGGCHDK
ncbi:MAG: cytochrome c3 family protein [Thermodesulfovibrionales bacterium]